MMAKKTRYFLIVLGFILFIILSPAIILYVRGETFDFTKKTFVATGMLAVRSQPQTADIFLNGKLSRTSSGDIRFITPGSYSIEIKKPNYTTWNKRLDILPGLVTWANPPSNNIYLFLNKPQEQNLAEGVLDFFNNSSQIVFLASGGAVVARLNTFEKQTVYPLPKFVDKMISVSPDGKNFIFSNSTSSQPVWLAFNADTGQISDISSLFYGATEFQFSDANALYALNNESLYKIDSAAKTKSLLFNKVKAFSTLSDSLYYIQNQTIYLSQSPFKDSQVLIENILPFKNEKLQVTFDKQIFLLADGSAYLASSAMQKLADNVSAWNFDKQNSTLTIIHGGQLDYYNILGNNLNFITRSNEVISNAVINNTVAGSFFVKNNSLFEIELDNRDIQNQFNLYPGKNIQKIFVDNEAKNITLLDNGRLKTLIIR